MKLFFRRMGQGNPVIILHGLLGLSDNWITFARQLATDYNVIVPDLRNHGQSPHDSRFDFPVLVEDVRELMRDLQLEKVSIIGHSLGGKTAMQFARKYPEMLDKLVVVDIAMRRYVDRHEHRVLMEAMMDADLARAGSRSDVDRMLEPKVRSLKLRQFVLKNLYWKDKETLAWRVNLPVLIRSFPEMSEAVSGDAEFGGPVLLVRGGLSDYVTDEDVVLMEKKFPRTSVVTLANASHWVHADVPGEFYNVVHEFLEAGSVPGNFNG
jgi:esterase